MKSTSLCRRVLVLVAGIAFSFGAVVPVLAQARRQPPSSEQKKNKRPTEGDKQTEEQKQEPLPPDIVGKQQEAEKLSVTTNVVNVDAVVYNKATGQPSLNLKKNNFAIPEAPITVTLVVEYSKTSEVLGYYGSGGMERGQNEVIRPTAMFLSQFITREDYVSIIA